ncbi:exported hypothetical protein [Candidatus Zixiibacteriota bacterium]|nr:exported hypothetical protein [candidate division Zixibacteria bacterium]
MRKLSGLLLLCLIITAPAFPDPGIPDTVRIDSVSAYLGGTAILPVYFFNDEPLSGLELTIRHDSELITLDSFSLAGGRLSYIPSGDLISRSGAGLFDLLVPDNTGFIPVGTGLFCNLYFSVSRAAAGNTFVIDTTYWAPASRTFLIDSEGYSIDPKIVKGYITVSEPPPSNDSIWIDTLTARTGKTAAVNIYGYNSEDISKIDLALTYSSADLIFDSVSYAGTRGVLASSRTVSQNPADRQVLVSLSFSSASLPVGAGPLATLVFTVNNNAPEERVIIDSASFLGTIPLEFTTGGGLTFAPYFREGYVDIKSGTAVEERKSPVIPTKYALAQNYPNPFNPSTAIKFDLPQTSQVKLEIFNILGQKIRTLINREMTAGSYDITFDGKGDDNKQLGSGVYFYRLRAGEFEQSRSMMLLK